MSRLVVVVLLAVAVWGGAAEPACAQAGGAEGWSGPGFYLNWIKLAACWLVFLLWVGTTDWVSRDAVEMKMDYLRWNPIVFGTFMAAWLVSWILPWFWVSFPLLITAHAGPLTAYIVYRNGRVEDHLKVMTPAHLRAWFAEQFSKLGVRIAPEKPDPFESGPVMLRATGGATEQENAARLFSARQSPGLLNAQTLLADALSRRADAVMLDYTQQGVGVRFLIDGLWQNGEPMERELADPMLEALKLLCGLKPADRQNRQEGTFTIQYYVFKDSVFAAVERAKELYRQKITAEVARELVNPEVPPAELQQRVKLVTEERVRAHFLSPIGHWTPVAASDLSKLKYAGRINPESSRHQLQCKATLTCQGTATGERALVQLEVQKVRFNSLDETGMRPKMQEQLKQLIGRERGFLLFSAMPGNGLRTTVTVVLRSLDRFSREFAAVEEQSNRYELVENVPVTTYDASAGQTPVSILPAFFHKEPHVVVIRDLVNAETVQMLLDQIPNNRVFLSTVRAKDCVEAIYRVLAMGVPAADFAEALTGVFNQRLVRKLCESCKEAYTPPAQVLTQLGIPPGKVQVFYRPPQQRDEVCPECSGIGYLGRTAIFEMLVPDSSVRQLLAAGAKPDAVRQAARKAGMRTLQEEGVVLVARGITSLPELVRVMKQ
ncbi:MAG: ATPase, T2SS/T4P/T4SS family [Thermoguttaceae bacterium]